jgi:hypothetical protein
MMVDQYYFFDGLLSNPISRSNVVDALLAAVPAQHIQPVRNTSWILIIFVSRILQVSLRIHVVNAVPSVVFQWVS